jgi:hypothetical protein
LTFRYRTDRFETHPEFIANSSLLASIPRRLAKRP